MLELAAPASILHVVTARRIDPIRRRRVECDDLSASKSLSANQAGRDHVTWRGSWDKNDDASVPPDSVPARCDRIDRHAACAH
jgi:hypothetical protein